MESIKSERKKNRNREGSGGLYAHLSPFFICGKKRAKNKKEEVCYEKRGVV